MSRKLMPVTVAALGALWLSTLPAASHSVAKCKFEFFDACLEGGGAHAVCVNYVELQCAGHTHGGQGAGSQAAGSDYHSSARNRAAVPRTKVLKRPNRRAFPQLQLVPPW